MDTKIQFVTYFIARSTLNVMSKMDGNESIFHQLDFQLKRFYFFFAHYSLHFRWPVMAAIAI